MDASILRVCSAEITSWISFRTARNRGELRLAVCSRGRGTSTSIEPPPVQGSELRTRTRSREVDGLVDVVRHVHDGHAASLDLAVDAQDDVLELFARECIDRGERLVEQQQPRAARREHGRWRPAAPFRPTAATGTCAPRPEDPGPAEPPRLARPSRLSKPRATQREHDVADHGQPREERAVVVLEDERDLRRRTQDGSAVQKHCAFTRPGQAAENAQERRLAAARRSDHARNSPAVDVERHVAQRRRAVRARSASRVDANAGLPAAPALARTDGLSAR